MYKFLPLFVLLLSFAACSPLLQSEYAGQEQIEQLPDSYDAPVTARYRSRGPCEDYSHYIPDTTRLNDMPVRKIRVNFHWMNTTDTLYRDHLGEDAFRFIEGLVISANKDLRENRKMRLPHGNDTPVLPTRLEWALTGRPGDPADNGIYHHFDDSLYYYVHKGGNANLYSQEVVNRYGVNTDSVLNVFLMPHHPDSVASSTYPVRMVGVGPRRFIKMAGIQDLGGNPWEYRGLLNHELGHILGLGHAWMGDGCDDTPNHRQECYSPGSGPGCDTLTSNNVMDYAWLQIAWTPCQIGRAHYRLSRPGQQARNYLEPRWCERRDDRTVYVSDSVNWMGARDLMGDVVIEATGRLQIGCRVSMPAGGRILIRPGGELLLTDGAHLHNDCGRAWDGIIVESQGESRGRIIAEGNYLIEDARYGF